MKVARLDLKGGGSIMIPVAHITGLHLTISGHIVLVMINGKTATLVEEGERGLRDVSVTLGWEEG